MQTSPPYFKIQKTKLLNYNRGLRAAWVVKIMEE